MAETIIDLKGNVIEADAFRGSVEGSVTNPAIEALEPLAGDSGGTANDAIETIPAATAADTDTSAASLDSTNDAITAIANDVADLQEKVNAIISALQA